MAHTIPRTHTKVKGNKLYLTVKDLECTAEVTVDWGDSTVEKLTPKHGALKACHKYANCNPSQYTVKLSFTAKAALAEKDLVVKVPSKSCSSSESSHHTKSSSESSHHEKPHKPCKPCWGRPQHPVCPKPLPVCDWRHPCGWKPLVIPAPVPPTPCYPYPQPFPPCVPCGYRN